jgi:hypothetical protein
MLAPEKKFRGRIIMFWWLLRVLFWWPRFTFNIVVGTSHTSAEEAERSALINARDAGGEIVGIAASAMCCGGEEGSPGAEWDVYLLLRT